MTYVYILRSVSHCDHFYFGVTKHLRTRLGKHNAGEVPHTSKYAPWTVKTYVAFTDEKRAIAFEKYLKSGSGRAFAKKRLEAAVNSYHAKRLLLRPAQTPGSPFSLLRDL